MGKKPRLTFRKNYKIKRAVRNKQRRQDDGSIDMDAEVSQENSAVPTCINDTSSEEGFPSSEPRQVTVYSFPEVSGQRAWGAAMLIARGTGNNSTQQKSFCTTIANSYKSGQ